MHPEEAFDPSSMAAPRPQRILHRSARAVEMEERVCVVVTTTRQMVELGVLANDLTFYNRSEGNVF
jgi:hypothetical protein